MLMDRNYIDLHLVADRYLQGTLAEGEKVVRCSASSTKTRLVF